MKETIETKHQISGVFLMQLKCINVIFMDLSWKSVGFMSNVT